MIQVAKYVDGLCLHAVESQTIDRATIAKINFILKGHSKFPFISSLKILGCAKTRRAPVFPTIQYIQSPYYVDFGTGKKSNLQEFV